MTDPETLHQLVDVLPESQRGAVEYYLRVLLAKVFSSLPLKGVKELYDTDFYTWMQDQAVALRAKNWAALDFEHLAEELEGMARSDRRALGNHLKNLLLHLLKWAYQPAKRGPSWQDSIEEAREPIEDLIEESRASLEAETQRQFAKQYARARRKASRETGLPMATFSEVCPWSITQVLDEDFWPEA